MTHSDPALTGCEGQQVADKPRKAGQRSFSGGILQACAACGSMADCKHSRLLIADHATRRWCNWYCCGGRCRFADHTHLCVYRGIVTSLYRSTCWRRYGSWAAAVWQHQCRSQIHTFTPSPCLQPEFRAPQPIDGSSTGRAMAIPALNSPLCYELNLPPLTDPAPLTPPMAAAQERS